VTQHGSFPDRPRGRRARHSNEVPQDEREFPDLPPIRDRRLSESDNRGLPEAGGRGRHSAPAGPDASASQVPWADPAEYPGPAEHGQPEYGQPAQYSGQRGQRHAPQPDYIPQDYAQQDYAAQQGRQGQQYHGQPQYDDPQAPLPAAPSSAVPPADGPSRRSRRAQQPRQQRSARSPESDSEMSDDPTEAFSERWRRRGADSPPDPRTRKRLYYITGGVALIAVAAIVLLVVNITGGKSGKVGFGSLVTTFLPGEIQKVPDACKAVSSATLSQYLPGGQPAVAFPPLNGGTDSQCTWTLDKAPTYRVIEVDINAFSPSGLASGNGSATFAASDSYAADLQTMQKPPANSGQPVAATTDIPGLGNAAFSATQVFNRNGTISYKATVFARYHNVIVTAVVNGLDKAITSKGTYGPVSMDTLKAAALQAAREALAQLPK
jgi:hypothetical protein